MDDLDMSFAFSDSESDRGSVSGSFIKKQRPTPYVNNRPRSAETLGSGGRAQRGTHAHPRWSADHRARDQLLVGDGLTRGQFVAIADYDPELFSQSGRRAAELVLREGDQVMVTGMLPSLSLNSLKSCISMCLSVSMSVNMLICRGLATARGGVVSRRKTCLATTISQSTTFNIWSL